MATHQLFENRIGLSSKTEVEKVLAEEKYKKQREAFAAKKTSCKTKGDSERLETLSVLAFLNCLNDYEATYGSVLC